jgi:hypothetical protein
LQRILSHLECDLAKTHVVEHHDPDNYSAAFALLKPGILFNRWLKKEPKEAAPEKRAKHKALREEFLRRQKRALERSSAVRPYPKFTELSEICGLSERQVRYAVKKCQEEIVNMTM